MSNYKSYFDVPELVRRILLMPAMPTPNGRLHLGHVAGPFMRMDILNRYFRTRGHDSLFCTGVDSFESHVLLRAHRDGVTPQETCSHFFSLIAEDLDAAWIHCDRFVNPADSDSSAEFGAWNREVIRRLERSGAVRTLNERIPRGVDSGRVIAGCWIVGNCPVCGSSASGYCCSDCGYHFRPDELVDARPRDWDEGLEWITVPSYHLEVSASRLLSQVDAHYPGASGTVRSFLARQQNLVRLSAPGEWGVPLPIEGSSVPQVVFSYTAIGFQLMVGDSFRALRGLAENGFDPDSSIEVVGGFGSDNVIPFFVGMQGSLVASGYRPFGRFLVNQMMSLEGEPFTTSGGHAIWVSDIVKGAGVHADVLRNHLARVNPEDQLTNLTVEGLVETTIRLAERWAQVQAIAETVRDLPVVPAAPIKLVEHLQRLLERQDAALNFATGVRIGPLPALVDEWLEQPAAIAERGLAYWWLKGLALLAYPLMPSWAAEQWAALGHDGIPRLSTFLEPRQPRGRVDVRYSPARALDIAACLPVNSSRRN